MDFLDPIRLSAAGLARKLHVPSRKIADALKGRRAIDADVDLRLTRYFGLSAGFYLGLQADFDLMARRRELGGDLESINPRDDNKSISSY